MALTEEQKTLLADCKSVIQQIESIEAGEENTQEKEENNMGTDKNEVQMEDQTMESTALSEEEEDDIIAKAANILKARKSKTMKSAEGVTGDDDAETRLRDDEPESNQSNVSEVAKSDIKEIKNAVIKMAKVVKSIDQKTDQNENAIVNILEGIGVVEDVQVSQPVRKSAPVRRRPVADRKKVLKGLNETIKSNVNKDQDSKADSAGLGDAMRMIFGQ